MQLLAIPAAALGIYFSASGYAMETLTLIVTAFMFGKLNLITSMIKEEKRKKPSDFKLSEREFKVLALIAEGLSNKEIAEKLFLGEGTVRNYITNILEKLELRDRTQLAIFYLKNF